MKIKNICFTLVSLLALWPGLASAWWNEDWAYRAPVHIDTTATGAAIMNTQHDVPVLIKLHTGNFQDFFLLKEDLSDLRLIAGDDKTPLKFHVESFDVVNQLMYLWVKVPDVTGSLNTEKIWMYYGNQNAVAASDKNGTYDVNTAMVHHFLPGDDFLADETAYGNRLVTSAGVTEPASLIGSGVRFTGEGGISLPSSTSTRLIPSNGITVSFWVKPDDASSAVLFSHTDGKNEIKVMNNADRLTARLVSASGAEFVTQPVAGYTPGVWNRITVAVSINKLMLYVNGVEGSSVDVQVPEIGGQIIFGADVNGHFPYKGIMDEIEYSNIIRPADYILMTAKNQGMENRLISVGESEQLGNAGGSQSHFAFVMSKLTFDAKVVIVFLLLMSILSWIVMIAKGIYLSRVAKDNKRFLAAYYALGVDDPAKLDHKDTEEDEILEDSPVTQALFGNHDHFQSSPIYHMYHRGISEVKARVGTSVGAQAVAMTAQSAEAIRATLDADLVRGTQKLNSKMVLLTIAISGGPFIGLLGTVIGVMITFADMASSGDVNIASIAPGMAAALMATIVGLWVAIPALFGYNYLGANIKNITADMHVFIDEFDTRVAEYYGK
jgi:biopolymer transport protein ExbB